MNKSNNTERSRSLSVRDLLEERSFVTLLEHVEEVFSLLDEEGRVLFRGPGWQRVLGYDTDTLEQMPPFSIVHPDDREDVAKAHREALVKPSERIGPVGVRIQDARGLWRSGDLSIVNLLGRADFGTVVFNWRDATGRISAERELAERARQQEAVAEFGRLALYGASLTHLMDTAVTTLRLILDVEYVKVLELRPGGKDLLLRAGVGWSEGLVGSATVGTGADSQAGYTLRSNKPVVVEDLREETRFRGPSLLLDHEVVSGMSVIIEGQDEPFGVLGAHTRKRREFAAHDVYFVQAMADVLAQAIVRERNLREIRVHSQLLDSVGEAVIAGDLDGTITYWNRYARELFGWPRKAAVGKNVLDLAPVDEGEEARAVLDTLRGGERWRGELVLRHRDGTDFPALVTGVPIEDPNGEIVGIVGIATDISEMKELEQRYLRAQRMEALGRLAGGIAHDFNNLLTAILGYTDLARERVEEDPEAVDTLGEVEKAAQRAMNLTSQLLAYSRRQILQPRSLDLNHVIEEMEPLVRRLIREDVDLEVNLDADAGTVRVDPGQLEQVIMNLAVNARDAIPTGGRLTIETGSVRLEQPYVHREIEVAPGDWSALTVTDTGKGMDVETREHLFEPFYTTKEAGEGTGLGLATVYGIVEQSGGHIWVYSEPGVGATFRVLLPRHHGPPRSPEPEPVDEMPGGTETILVVEDEDAVRELVCKVLSGLGYRILEASNGVEAVEMAAAHDGPIDLAFTDIVMPELRGWELAQRLRETRPETKVVFASGYPGDRVDDAARAEFAGAKVVAKPFTPGDLARAIREVLDS